MKAVRRWLAAVMALPFLLAGCSLDVESFLQPPRMQGEEQAVQQALETYLRDSGLSQMGRYTLKYPSEGTYTSAFVLCDRDGQPLEGDMHTDRAQLAVAFYALASAPEETHVNLLYRSGNEWVSMGDYVGSGTDIRQVLFGDLNGDGTQELLTGWSTYNSREHRLMVHSMADGLTTLSDDRLYTRLYVGDVTAAGSDTLLRLHIGSDTGVTASLERLEADGLHTVDTVPLDRHIRQFGRMTFSRLAEGTYGLYVDAVKNDDTTITELIYYDDTGLCTPFYDPVTGITSVTARAGGLACRDVDGDGQVEIPVHRPFPAGGGTPDHMTGQLTVWCGWDYATRQLVDRLVTVANPADGYLVVPDTTQVAQLDTHYTAESRMLELRYKDTGATWLWLCTGEERTTPPAEGLTALELLEDGSGTPLCVAWFDSTQMDEEKVRYTVLSMTEEGG